MAVVDKPMQLFILSLMIILVASGLTYRWSVNETQLQQKELQTKFDNLQSVVDSKNSLMQTELSSLRRDLEANTEAMRRGFGEKFSELETKVESQNTQQSEQISGVLSSLLGEVEDIKKRSDDIASKVSTVAADNGDFSAVIEKAKPAVVNIQAGNTIGSGFFIDREGLTVTNFHVVQGAADIKVITDQRITYRASILAYDAVADIAILRLQTPRQDFQFLEWGDSDAITQGEPVVAIGNPAGLSFSVSKGVIGSKERRGETGVDLVQLDLAINPGNSGGPIINKRGEVVGIAVGYRELEVLGLDRIGFAIESNFAKKKVEELRASVFGDI